MSQRIRKHNNLPFQKVVKVFYSVVIKELEGTF